MRPFISAFISAEAEKELNMGSLHFKQRGEALSGRALAKRVLGQRASKSQGKCLLVRISEMTNEKLYLQSKEKKVDTAVSQFRMDSMSSILLSLFFHGGSTTK